MQEGFVDITPKIHVKIWNLIKSIWWKGFFMLSTILICFFYADSIDGVIASKMLDIGLSPIKIYYGLDRHYALNVLFTIGIIIGFGQLIVMKCEDRFLSFMNTTIAICSIILLCVQTKWCFSTSIIPSVGYDLLLSVGAFLYIIATIVGLSRRKVIKDRPNAKLLTLYSDHEGNSRISENRAKYAEQLAERLLNTDISKEAYAVGITGEWGSGKTLFLKAVESRLKGRAIIVEFNPWNSKDEKHLAKDFLKTLSKKLSKQYSGISSPIIKYTSLLYSLRMHVASDYILQYLPKQEEKDLAERKDDIEKALDKIGKPVAVFIDDIDRLEGKEIFEVLRIIRNMAVFRHVIYVVAYDKTHVVNQLSELGIGNGADYLEKIFQMEVMIPKLDERMLIEELKTACRLLTVYVTPINSMLDKLGEDDYHQIMKELTSCRKVKRFARQFAFNASFMMTNLVDRNFELRDLLLLNLIENNDSEKYKLLWHNPEVLLEVRVHPDTNAKYYFWKKNEDGGDCKKLTFEYLMESLFGRVPGPQAHSIQYVDLFYKYFYLAQPEKDLSSQDFLNMLQMSTSPNTKGGMMETIRDWVLSKENKSCNSIYRQFVNYKTIEEGDSKRCYNYLDAVFYWLELEERQYDYLNILLPMVLDKSRFKDCLRSHIKEQVNKKIAYFADRKKYLTAAIVLSELYKRLDAGDKLLVDIKVVETALNKNTELFLKSKTWDPICLFRNDDNMMRKVMVACCVPLKSKFNRKENLVIEQVIEYYSEQGHQSNSYRDANEAKRKIPYQNVYSYQPTADSDMGDLKQVFGNDLGIANRMLESCFVGIE